MALVLVDGFDHYGAAEIAEKFWNGQISAMVPGRGFGGQAMDVVVNNPVYKIMPSTYSTVIAAAAFKINGGPGLLMNLETASGAIVAALALNASDLLTLTDSAGNLIATGTTTVPVGTWFQIELKVIVGSSGHGTVHLNGGPEIASTLGNFGTTNVGRISFWCTTLGGDTFVDDVVVIDTSGSAPTNDFLGDIRVETIYPVADGSYTDWTPKFGTDHYQMVNEHLIDGDGSFVYDANPGDKDSYILETFIGTIFGAQLNIGARKGDAPLRQIKPLIKQSGTDYLGALATLSSDYVFYSWQLDKDPSGADWLAATINADEFGQVLEA